jgi:hypothetical protein
MSKDSKKKEADAKATSSTATDAGAKKLVTRLPDYFPTYVPQCEAPAKEFFACFEKEAEMKHPKDVVSAPNSLIVCQSKLLDYMQCQEKNFQRETKQWWKRW